MEILTIWQYCIYVLVGVICLCCFKVDLREYSVRIEIYFSRAWGEKLIKYEDCNKINIDNINKTYF